MLVTSASSLLALGLAVQQAAATGWTDVGFFSSPSNTNNQCDEQQKGGFDWNGLNTGSFNSYGGMGFSGFKCTNSFSKRSTLYPRTFQSKCIEGSVGTDHSSGPKISCEADKTFSITKLQVSVEFDTELHFIYGMADGSTCKHTASCSASGSTVANSQCGGAKSVTFQLPKGVKKSSCSVGIHSVGFDCNAPSSTLPVSTALSTAAAASSSSSTLAAESSIATPSSTPSASSSSTLAVEGSSTAASSTLPVEISTTAAPSMTPLSSSTSFSIFSTPIGNLSVTATPINPNTAADSSSAIAASPSTPVDSSPPSLSAVAPLSSSTSAAAPGTTQEVVTTEIVFTTVTTCPVTNTVTSGTTEIIQTTQTISTVTSTITSTVCTKCIAPTPSASIDAAPSVPVSTEAIPSTDAPSSPVAPSSDSPSSPPLSSPASSSTAAAAVTTPVPSIPGSTQEVVTTEIVYTTVTTCPVTNTITSGATQIIQTNLIVSTVTATTTSTICTKCVAPAPTSAPTSAPNPSSAAPLPVTSSSAPAPAPDCPFVLPKCLNTWIYSTGCQDNSDSDCFCKQSGFTTSVIGCVQAHGADDSEIQAALSYLVGICAPHVGENPAIITAVPTTITLCPTPAPAISTPLALSSPTEASADASLAAPVASTPLESSGSPASSLLAAPLSSNSVAVPLASASPVSSALPASSVPAVAPSSDNIAAPVATGVAPTAPPGSVPATIISISTVITVPVTYETGASAGFTIPDSSTTTVINTVVTVPQVGFTTVAPSAPGETPSVGLAAGSPNANPNAYTTGTSVPTTLASILGSTAAPNATSIAGAVPFEGAAIGLSAPGLTVALVFGGIAVALMQL